jgi:ABC-type antimicrobial peptide transport system permease subunit
LYLSGFNPIAVLKGKLNRSVGEVWARKGLVVFQFALSIIFIVSVLVVYKQIEYAQTKNLGYEKDNVIYFEKEGKVNENLESFLAQIKTIPGVMQASSIAHNMVGHNTAITDLKVTGEKVTPGLTFEDVAVNYDLLETLGIQIKEGRSFSRQFKTDDAAVIFNEAAIQAMGLQNPVGKTVFVEGRDRKIVGVAKDFHFQSFHENIKPLVFRLEPEYSRKIMVKIAAGQEQAVIEKLQEFYKTYNPGFVLDYTFLDEKYQAQYAAEQRVSVLSRYFAVLAILISCLGLFGLAAFTAERRRKEIGVRKVLGASDLNIIYLLSSDFTRLVVVAICISLPLSYLIVKHWLNNFEYRIDLQWWYFAGAGMAALLVAWLTVGSQAVKAASVNPVQSLKDE